MLKQLNASARAFYDGADGVGLSQSIFALATLTGNAVKVFVDKLRG